MASIPWDLVGWSILFRIKSSGLMNLTWSLYRTLHSKGTNPVPPGLGSSPLHVWAWKGPFHIKLAVQPHPQALLRGA